MSIENTSRIVELIERIEMRQKLIDEAVEKLERYTDANDYDISELRKELISDG